MSTSRPSGRTPICIGKMYLIAHMDGCAKSIVSLHTDEMGLPRLDYAGRPTIPRWNVAYMAVLRAHRVIPADKTSKLNVYGSYMDERPDDFQRAYYNAIREIVIERLQTFARNAAGIISRPTPADNPPHII